MKYSEHYKHVERPDWTNFFLGLCFNIAERSEDAETQHGCILTDQDNHIIGTGYNALSRGVEPGELPNTRPLKYDFMIHAEENAILNTTIDPRLIPGGAISYCTAKPCLRCLHRLWNKNIRTFYVPNTNYHFKDYEKEQEDFDSFIQKRGIRIIVVETQLEWLKRPIEKLQRNGLIT